MRPHKTRRIGHQADVTYFKPQGIPMKDLQEAILPLDCLEAMRLADVEGLYHQDAAERMGVSRATFGRILERGRTIVASALIDGHALSIGGGPVEHVACGHGRGMGRGKGRGMGRGNGPGKGRGRGGGGGRGQGRRNRNETKES